MAMSNDFDSQRMSPGRDGYPTPFFQEDSFRGSSDDPFLDLVYERKSPGYLRAAACGPAYQAALVQQATTFVPRDWKSLLDSRNGRHERVNRYLQRRALTEGLRHVTPSLGLFVGDVDVPEVGEMWQHNVSLALREGDGLLARDVASRLGELLPFIRLRQLDAHSFDPRPYRRVTLMELKWDEDRVVFLAINERYGVYEIRLATRGQERRVAQAQSLDDLLQLAAAHYYNVPAGNAPASGAANDPY